MPQGSERESARSLAAALEEWLLGLGMHSKRVKALTRPEARSLGLLPGLGLLLGLRLELEWGKRSLRVERSELLSGLPLGRG